MSLSGHMVHTQFLPVAFVHLSVSFRPFRVPLWSVYEQVVFSEQDEISSFSRQYKFDTIKSCLYQRVLDACLRQIREPSELKFHNKNSSYHWHHWRNRARTLLMENDLFAEAKGVYKKAHKNNKLAQTYLSTRLKVWDITKAMKMTVVFMLL